MADETIIEKAIALLPGTARKQEEAGERFRNAPQAAWRDPEEARGAVAERREARRHDREGREKGGLAEAVGQEARDAKDAGP